MSSGYKKIFLIIFTVFLTVFWGGFQMSFINRFAWGFNIFLVLILFFIFNQNIHGAVFLSLLGGFLIDTTHFSRFGISSLVLLLLTGFLIIFQKKALWATRLEGILLAGTITVFLYRFFEWSLNNIFNSEHESFGFYFFNFGILIELLLVFVLLSAIFSSSATYLWREAK